MLPTRCHFTIRRRILIPGVFVVVAVETQQLPVAAVGWVVVVVMILVMNGEFTQPFPAEFPTTPGADPGIHFKCLFPVGFFALAAALPGLGDYVVRLFFT